MRKQSIGIWPIGGRRRCKQTRVFFPVGVLASPVLGGITSNLAGPLIRKIIGGRQQTPQY